MSGLRIQSYVFGNASTPSGEQITPVAQIGSDGTFAAIPGSATQVLAAVTSPKLVKVSAIGGQSYVGIFGTGAGMAAAGDITAANGDHIADGSFSIYSLNVGQGLTALTAALS